MRTKSLFASSGILASIRPVLMGAMPVIAGLGLMSTLACSKKHSSSTTTTTAAAPTINSFTASPLGLTSGQSTTLSWNVSDATDPNTGNYLDTTVSIDNGIGEIVAYTLSIKPEKTTTYTLTAKNSSATATSTVTITVQPAPVGTLSILAGLPRNASNLDGTTATATFNNPSDVAVDGNGNLFVADSANNTIRKISAGGAVTTLAGQPGQAGFFDGTDTSVTFTSPSSVAVDPSGNVYVADTGNSTIRKITMVNGVATTSTFAGRANLPGYTNGKGGNARFNSPYGIATDTMGNLYVADTNNSVIRKITSDGMVSTLAGSPNQSGSNDGKGVSARFSSPTGVAVDSQNNVYVADYGNQTIRMITPDGTVSTLAGSPKQTGSADGKGSAARFSQPYRIAVDKTFNVYVADMANSTIRMIAPDGSVSTLAGTAGLSGTDNGTGAAARFFLPSGLAADTQGNIFVADSGNQLIRTIASGAAVTTLTGHTPGAAIGSADGTMTAARFANPTSLVSDAAGNIYVADSDNHTIRKITPAGVVTTFAGLAGTSGSTDGADARFNTPSGISIDKNANLYVADTGNHTIRKITSNGIVSTLAGTVGTSGVTDGTGTTALFKAPKALVSDPDGNLFVADTGNDTIRKITPAGVVTTFAGVAGVASSYDGTGAGAYFNQPYGICRDGSGNLFVADTGGSTIRQITPAAVVTTYAGLANTAGSTDDTSASARFFYPISTAVDPAGNVYVADWGNSTIRKISKGIVTTLAGSRGRTLTATGALPASIDMPMGLAWDAADGTLVVSISSAILKISF